MRACSLWSRFAYPPFSDGGVERKQSSLAGSVLHYLQLFCECRPGCEMPGVKNNRHWGQSAPFYLDRTVYLRCWITVEDMVEQKQSSAQKTILRKLIIRILKIKEQLERQMYKSGFGNSVDIQGDTVV